MDGAASLALRLAQRLDRRLYYGWIVVGVVFSANLAAFAINPTFGLFVVPLEQEFGWDRGTLGRSLTLGTVVGAVLSPLLGALSDRIGVRRLIAGCGAAAAAGLVLLSQVQAAWQYNLLLGLCSGLLTTGVGSVLGSLAISRWFVRRRGRAMGIVMMGASCSSLLFVLLHTFLLATAGWRTAYLVQGALTFALVVLPAWLLFVEKPEALGAGVRAGEAPVAAGSPTPGDAPRAEEHSWTLREAARTRAFWLTLAGVMCGSFPVVGFIAHAVPVLRSHGVPAAAAGTAVAAFFATSILSKFVWGFAIERLGVRFSLAICFAAEAGGLALLSVVRTPPAVFAWAVCSGLGHGPYLQLLAMVWADYFGRRSLGAIFGTVQPFIVLAASLGPWVAGLLYDASGGYDAFLRVAIALTLLAGTVFVFDPPPRKTDR